jgi:creatinine amidohydrolase
MPSSSDSLLLTRLSWHQVRDHLDRDRRLILPLGACDQYGAHLPIGASILVAEAFARQLSLDFEVLRAPVLPFGVNAPAVSNYPGAGGIREKTLHALLNDLLASWEDHGFDEFILITVHDPDAHVEAAATVTGIQARIRVIEPLNLDLSSILEGPNTPQHGGETLTSLMLHLYPDLVRMDLAEDEEMSGKSSSLRRLPMIPAGSMGAVGQPSLASAEKGRRLYEHIYQKIRRRVFLQED